MCREKYSYTIWRKEQILKSRKFLNEVLVDQIPPLAEVQRALDELSFLDPPHSTEEKFRSTLVIEPVPRLMDSINRGTDWKAMAAEHQARLTDPAAVLEQSKEMSSMIDMIMGMSLNDSEAAGDAPASDAEIKHLLQQAGFKS
eukprot:gene1246-1934_t